MQKNRKKNQQQHASSLKRAKKHNNPLGRLTKEKKDTNYQYQECNRIPLYTLQTPE